jgi:type I restriction enzyme S subunit
MAGEFKRVLVSEVCELIVDCVNKTAPVVEEITPYKMLRTTNIRGGRIDREECRRVSKETFVKWTRRADVRHGDVILTREAPLGEVGYVDFTDTVFLGQRLMQYRANRALLEPRFLLYSFLSQDLQNQFGAHEGSGSTVSHIRVGDCSKFKIPLPPLAEQKAIAAVLGALDDKIELNRRMNATLEAMARALFQSWFVDFDPVRAKMEGRQPAGMDAETAALFPEHFGDSELGEIPKGWRAGTLGELVELRTDRVDATPAKDNARYIALEDMPSKSIDLSSFQLGSAVNSSIIAFRKGDVLFGSMRPYFHKVGLAFFDGITRTTTFVLRPRKDCFRHFALLHFFSDDVVVHSTTASVGTTIPYVRWDSMESYRIQIPPDSLLDAFEKTVSQFVQRIAAQGEESRTLATLRDTLLPKLLSGELSVREVDTEKEVAV